MTPKTQSVCKQFYPHPANSHICSVCNRWDWEHEPVAEPASTGEPSPSGDLLDLDWDRVRELCLEHGVTDADILKHRLEDHVRWHADIISGRLIEAARPSEPSALDGILGGVGSAAPQTSAEPACPQCGWPLTMDGNPPTPSGCSNENCPSATYPAAPQPVSGGAPKVKALKADTLFGVYCSGNPESVPKDRVIYWEGWQRAADYVNRVRSYFPPASQTPDHMYLLEVIAGARDVIASLQKELGRVPGGYSTTMTENERLAAKAVADLDKIMLATPASTARTDGWEIALRELADCGDCDCDHDDENCCAKLHIPCAQCTAAVALAEAGIMDYIGEPAAPGSVPQARYCKECWEEHLPAFCKDNPIRVSADAEAFIKANLRTSDNEGLKQSEAKGEKH